MPRVLSDLGFPAVVQRRPQSKTNSEFVSASSDGRLLWWDCRNLKVPFEECRLLASPPPASSAASVSGSANSASSAPTLEGAEGELLGVVSLEWSLDAGVRHASLLLSAAARVWRRPSQSRRALGPRCVSVYAQPTKFLAGTEQGLVVGLKTRPKRSASVSRSQPQRQGSGRRNLADARPCSASS